MKLIIKEYLSQLREREGLDALLPDLLSQMGLHVFSRPGKGGGRQYGVDVAAVGTIDVGPKKVYLFSIKAGDLGRKAWNSGLEQDMEPSLYEIQNVYILNHIPPEHKKLPVEICICFGGDLKEELRLNVTSHIKNNKTKKRSFAIWGGELLAEYIEKYFLNERLMLEDGGGLLRKSLAMNEEPDVSYKYFYQLIKQLSNQNLDSPKKIHFTLLQIHLCLGILFSWCKDGGNLESAYLSSELALLHSWEISKPFFAKNGKKAKSIQDALIATQKLHVEISTCYLEKVVIPHVNKPYVISRIVKSPSSVDVNLKLFDILGRLAIAGLWALWNSIKIANSEDEDNKKEAAKQIHIYQQALKGLISNNPLLFTPYKEDQAIDIALAVLFLTLSADAPDNLHNWLYGIVQTTSEQYYLGEKYLSTISDYHKLLEHPYNDGGAPRAYMEKVSSASILYPLIAAISAIMGFDNIYTGIKELKSNILNHSNFQFWFPGKTSEEFFYNNNDQHGSTLSHVEINDDQNEFLSQALTECNESMTRFGELSAIKYQYWPIILTACRHYRLPIPFHFFQNFLATTEDQSVHT